MRKVTKTTAVWLALLLAALTGCAARINRLMASWQGHNANQLIARWGPPTNVYDDGNGTRILTWVYPRSFGEATARTTCNGIACNTTYHPPATWQVYRMFFVDTASGLITGWSWRGF
jgi:hypothetical protein